MFFTYSMMGVTVSRYGLASTVSGTGISSFSQSARVCAVSSELMSTVMASSREGRDARA
ncbi:hypothetical protein D9M72_370990 [compost metagenome]